ncbi:Phenylacetate--CoA ligase family protein [Candidatus Electrothrix aarhusensis]
MLNQLFFKYGVYFPVVFLRGERVPTYLKKLMHSQFCTYEQLKELQLKKVNALLSYAQNNVPYYRETIQTSSLQTLQNLDTIPFIDKNILRNNQQQLIADTVEAGVTKKTTGGSTGAPVTIAKSKDAMAQELAAAWRGFSWAGINIGDKQGKFWGVPHSPKEKRRAKLIDFVCNRYRCSAFSFNEQDLEKYYLKLKRFRPRYFYGYVSMLIQFANFIKKNGLDLPCSLQCIITTAEVLSESDRKLLHDVFRCKVYNEYGCGEIGTIAHECEEGNLHINDENIIIEVVNAEGAPLKPGKLGEIVVTELNNFSMPLIRYRLADYGMLSTKKCSCGRELKVLEKVAGREYDFLVNSKGQRFHGEFFLYIIEDIKNMGALLHGVQFVQNAIDQLTINIVPHGELDKTFKKIIVNQIHKDFDPKIQVDIIEVNQIHRENSGKLRVIKNCIGSELANLATGSSSDS